MERKGLRVGELVGTWNPERCLYSSVSAGPLSLLLPKQSSQHEMQVWSQKQRFGLIFALSSLESYREALGRDCPGGWNTTLWTPTHPAWSPGKCREAGGG